jgi:hypothetical protein
MSYATADDLTAYAADLTVTIPLDPATVDRLLARAAEDVDRVIGPYAVWMGGDRKLDPALLTTAARSALSRATCAQACHRLALGADYFDVEVEDLLAGDIRVLKSAQRITPRVAEILSGSGLLRRSGTLQPLPAA